MGLKILVSLVRFPVAPQNERELQQCNSFFITLCICSKTVGRNSTPDYAAGQTIRPRKRFPATRIFSPIIIFLNKRQLPLRFPEKIRREDRNRIK